jgi:hypothetical protein
MQHTQVFKAAGLTVLNLVIGLLLLADLIVVIGLLVAGVPGWISLLFFVSFLPAALIWFILPRRFEVWHDRLVIVFPVVMRWTLSFDTIETVEVARWWHAYAFMGVRFASNPGKSVDIIRRQPNVISRPNVVISPEDRDEFIALVNGALAEYRPLREGTAELH